MIYKISKERAKALNLPKHKLIRFLNDSLCFSTIEQRTIYAEDRETGKGQLIDLVKEGVHEIRMITDVIIS